MKRQKKTILTLTILSLSILITSFSTGNNEFFKKIQNKFDTLNKYYIQEKVYLHLDKPYYSGGEDIWFKTYLVNGNNHKTKTISKIIYVDLINPSNIIVDSKTIKINDGTGQGEFKLETNLSPGNYTIRAYSNFMRNFDSNYFFKKSIYINSTKQKVDATVTSSKKKKKNSKTKNSNSEKLSPDVQFFPEGGNMVNGLLNRIGFKAIGTNGKGIDIVGTVVDNTGIEILKFKTSKFGLGRLNFMPEQDKSYTAKIAYNNQNYNYKLPSGLPKGVLLQIEERKDNFKIIVQSSLSSGVNNLMIIGQQRGNLVSRIDLKGQKKQSIATVSKKDFKDGIVHFTLFNKNEVPLCERLVFVNKNTTKVKLNVAPTKNNYQKRELVEVEVSLKNQLENFSEANLSVSITDTDVVQAKKYASNINSYLLLGSDLKGEVENPGYYFENNDIKRKRELDLLMMTQGWRRFDWTEILKDSLPQLKHHVETGIRFKGVIKKFINRKKSTVAEVFLTLKNDNLFQQDQSRTNEQGRFSFGDYDLNDTTAIMIQAKKKKYVKGSNKMNYFIELDERSIPKVPVNKFTDTNPFSDQNNKYISRSASIQYYDSLYRPKGEFEHLDEVMLKQVTSQKADKHKREGMIYTKPSDRLDFEELHILPADNVLNMLRGRVAGMVITGTPPNMSVTIRAATSFSNQAAGPLFILDGMEVDIDVITNYPIENIEFVDVLKGPRAAVYGSNGANGVILVYTKRFDPSKKPKKTIRKGITTFTHPGYYKARKFYEPKYAVKKAEHNKPDHRSTLYWNPDIVIKENVKIKFSFYAADIETTYKIELEGITSEGTPLNSKTYFNVE